MNQFERGVVSFWERGLIPKRGSRKQGSEKHDTKPELEYLMEDPKPLTKTRSVKKAALRMIEEGKRTIAVTDAGTSKLIGEIKARDILDLFGGGVKTNIIEEKFKGNVSEALNLQIGKIMNKEPVSADIKEDLVSVISQLKDPGVETVFVTDEKRLVGKITERKILSMLASTDTGKKSSDLMTEEVITGGVGYTVSDACKIMVRNNVNRLPIIENHELEGMVTYSDLLRYYSKEMFRLAKATTEDEVFGVTVENIMTHRPVSVKPDTDISEVLDKMKETGHGALPVAKDNKLKGIITRTDIIKAIK